MAKNGNKHVFKNTICTLIPIRKLAFLFLIKMSRIISVFKSYYIIIWLICQENTKYLVTKKVGFYEKNENYFCMKKMNPYLYLLDT